MVSRVPQYRPSWMPSPAERDRQYRSSPSRKADKAFYESPAWRAVRLIVLQSQPLCIDCRRRGLTVPAKHVHHVIDRKARPDLALVVENLEALCVSCHGRKRRGR